MNEVFILFFILSGISILCSLAVLTSLYRLGSLKSCFSFLLFWFHGSMIGQEITVLPLVYNSSHSSCVAMEFLHYFFGLMNILIVTMLVEAHRSSLFVDYFRSRKLIMKFGSYVLICFPLITALPFAVSEFTIKYDDDGGGWCVLPYDRNSTWIIMVYYLWVWTFLSGSIISMTYSAYYVCKNDRLLAQKFMSTIGLYVIVAIFSWIPRSFERVDQMNSPADRGTYFIAFLPISISGILYSLIYIKERHSLLQFQEEAGDDGIAAGSFSFTWEKDDYPEELISVTNYNSHDDSRSHPSSLSTASDNANNAGNANNRTSWLGRGSTGRNPTVSSPVPTSPKDEVKVLSMTTNTLNTKTEGTANRTANFSSFLGESLIDKEIFS